jgi:hypothetical protein
MKGIFRKVLVFYFLTALQIPICCQEKSLSDLIASIAEELAEKENEMVLQELYSDMLSELSQDPVKINTGDKDEIGRLFFLTDFQVSMLADHVRSTGNIVSIAEISNLPGFTRLVAEMISPFITLGDMKASANYKDITRQSLLANFIIKPGTYDAGLEGSQLKSLFRYKITAGRLSGNLTAEKDAGEKFLTGRPPVPDFLSANISWRGTGIIRRIVIGDFSARYGLGTCLNTGWQMSYSLTSPVIISVRDELRPYSSSDENSFFRGAALAANINRFDISFFLSLNRVDGTLNPFDSAVSPSVKSLLRTGYHNTPSTISSKDAVVETAAGVSLSWSSRFFRSGAVFSENRFSLPVFPDSTGPGYPFSFRGDRSRLFSAYYSGSLKKVIFSGEMSLAGTASLPAVVQAVAFRPSGRLNINFMLMYFPPGFTVFHGNAGGSYLYGGNESRVYGSFQYEAAKYLFISGGCEVIQYKWLRYRSTAPSSSARYEIRARFNPPGKAGLEIVVGSKSRMYDLRDGPGIPAPVLHQTISAKAQGVYRVSENLKIIFRADFRKAGPGGSTGIMMLQEVIFSLRKVPLSFWSRYCIFRTDDYVSAIYTWEHDLLYSFSVPAMYGTGSHGYLMIKLEPFRNAEMRFKYGYSRVSGEDSPAEIINEFKSQFCLRF